MYKKILCLTFLVLTLSQGVLAEDVGTNDFAAPSVATTDYNPGFYFGGQIGTANLHYRGSEYTTATSSYDNKYKFAGRGYVGYAFSQFISLELGYNYYGYPKFQHNPSGNTQDFLQHGMDFVVKANLPLDYGFSVYAKGGMAWIHRSALHPNPINNVNTFANKEANSKFPLIGGIGVNYWFAPHIALDLAWTKTMTVGSLPTIDLFTLGFIYKLNI